jgi:hypothetical protein
VGPIGRDAEIGEEQAAFPGPQRNGRSFGVPQLEAAKKLQRHLSTTGRGRA